VPEPAPGTIAVRNAVVLLLACAAGGVDAVSFTGLGRVFTANMTGNTVLLGLALGQAEAGGVARSGLAVIGFVAGVAVGALIAARGARGQVWPPGATAALAVEWVLLVAFAAVWIAAGEPEARPGVAAALIALSSLAMGVQSAVARRLDVSGIATTYITGTLTSLACSSIDRLRAPRDPRAATTARLAGAPLSLRPEALLAATWVVYVAGAAAVAAAARLGPPPMLGLPVAAVTLVIVLAARRLRG
jgi:uncharacterized membrane protein YoaK (UPF0700 family)